MHTKPNFLAKNIFLLLSVMSIYKYERGYKQVRSLLIHTFNLLAISVMI